MDLVAIPLFCDEVAPRFCSAHEFLLVRVGAEGTGAFRRTRLRDDAWSVRLERLRRLGTSVVLCGGFDSRFLPFARGLGLRVESGLAGPARALAEAFGTKDLDRYRVTGDRVTRRRTKMGERRTLAIAAMDDSGLDAQVSGHFGRCPWYVLVDISRGVPGETKVVSTAAAGPHTPGRMPDFVAGLGADVVLAGGMGPRAIKMFEGMGVEVATGARGTVREAAVAFLGGGLTGTPPCAHDHPDSCGGHDA